MDYTNYYYGDHSPGECLLQEYNLLQVKQVHFNNAYVLDKVKMKCQSEECKMLAYLHQKPNINPSGSIETQHIMKFKVMMRLEKAKLQFHLLFKHSWRSVVHIIILFT